MLDSTVYAMQPTSDDGSCHCNGDGSGILLNPIQSLNSIGTDGFPL